MIELPNITIICVETINPLQGYKVLRHCCKNIRFGRAKLITSEFTNFYGWIDHPPIEIVSLHKETTWNEYNDIILHLNKYIETDFALLVQPDGFILNTNLWDNNWLNYDCIGAPWPDEDSWLKLQTPRLQACFNKNTRVGNGGFTLRSKKFLELTDKIESCNGLGEDNIVCCEYYDYMIKNGIKYAPPEVAIKFSVENPVCEMGISNWRNTGHPNFNTDNSFGWHGQNLSNSRQLMDLIK